MNSKLRVGIIGCGLIGTRRAEIASSHGKTVCVLVSDVDSSKAKALARRVKCEWTTIPEDILNNPDINVVIISTPNKWLVPLAKKAIKQRKYVLIEKPMGRNLKEAKDLALASRKYSSLLKIGFNHRYHPALLDAKRAFDSGKIGKPLFIRAIYGHGGRPGYDKEWRADPKISGGGEILDQGVHLTDLIHWFFGLPQSAMSVLPRYVWATHRIEDNGFVLFSWRDGKVAQLHTSWTQWENRFEFEIYGTKGSLEVRGLGGSYGTETLTQNLRRFSGGIPTTTSKRYEGKDLSWIHEWDEFVQAIQEKKKYMGTLQDGLAAMKMLDSIYRANGKSARV